MSPNLQNGSLTVYDRSLSERAGRSSREFTFRFSRAQLRSRRVGVARSLLVGLSSAPRRAAVGGLLRALASAPLFRRRARRRRNRGALERLNSRPYGMLAHRVGICLRRVSPPVLVRLNAPQDARRRARTESVAGGLSTSRRDAYRKGNAYQTKRGFCIIAYNCAQMPYFASRN